METPQQKASFRRHYCCRNCGAAGVEVKDGSRCGGMPGLNYKYCAGCGHAQPLTKRMSRKEARASFKDALEKNKSSSERGKQ